MAKIVYERRLLKRIKVKGWHKNLGSGAMAGKFGESESAG